MRVLVDYRPALRQRSGVGEYTHELVRALIASGLDRDNATRLDLTLFSSSWKDRLRPERELHGARAVDRRIPVAVLNFAWHRLSWPAAETLAGGPFDVTHSMHPLLLPARDAAQVITIYDLDFLEHPERTRAEIRRDYPALARRHAQRADAIVVISRFTAREVERHFEIPADRIALCTPGAPAWSPRDAPSRHRGYVLFLGTLEPRKNIGGLLDAYERLVAKRSDLPELVIAGKATDEAAPWLQRLTVGPLAKVARYIGYVERSRRHGLYEGARLLVQPSFGEGFGMPVLEAMTIGLPVVAADRGALPEVLGDAGLLVDPTEPGALASAIERMIDDDAFASQCVAKGIVRARAFSWKKSADRLRDAYENAIEHRRGRRGIRGRRG